MGLLDIFRKREKRLSLQGGGKKDKGLVIEELDLTMERKRAVLSRRERKALPSNVDEKKRFMEIVEKLRIYAGLPPVEEAAKKEKDIQPVRRELPAQAVQEQSSEAKREVEPPRTTPPQPSQPSPYPPGKRYSKAEIDKLVKVSLGRLERRLMEMLEEDLRSRGIRSFKERAMARRRIREYMKSHTEPLSEEFVRALKEGLDPRDDEFVEALARKVYPEVRGEPLTPRTVESPSRTEEEREEVKGEEPRKKEGEKKEDLVELLGERADKEEGSDVDDLLKLLQE